MGYGSEQFSKEAIKMGKCLLKCSISLAMWEMQIKAPLRFLSYVKEVNIKKIISNKC